MAKRATILGIVTLLFLGIGASGLLLAFPLAQGLLLVVGGIGMGAGCVLLNVTLAMFRKVEQSEKQL